jgi:hypothetical protein
MDLPAFRFGQRVVVVVSTISTAGAMSGFDPPPGGTATAAFAGFAVFTGVVVAAMCMGQSLIPTPSSDASRVQTQNAVAIRATCCCRRMNRGERAAFSTAIRRSPDPL